VGRSLTDDLARQNGLSDNFKTEKTGKAQGEFRDEFPRGGDDHCLCKVRRQRSFGVDIRRELEKRKSSMQGNLFVTKINTPIQKLESLEFF
jgi:hypothetical protein